MKCLVRNCTHFSNVYVLFKYDTEGQLIEIYKSTSDKDNVQNIRNERDGISWYNTILDNEIIKINSFFSTDNYSRIIMNSNPGMVITDLSYKNNIRNIERCVSHYKTVWGKFKDEQIGRVNFPMHGDFSLANVLIEKNKNIVLIDWEHFNFECAPIGFDIIFLLVESLYFEAEKYTYISEKTVKHFRELIKELIIFGLIDANFQKFGYFNFLKDFIDKNHHLWGKQINKIPFINNINNKYIDILKKFAF